MTTRGVFDPALVVGAWFDPDTQAAGWWADDLVDVAGGAMSGAATVAFSTAGALVGTGAMAGSTALTFAPTAALGGGGALTGATVLSFAPAASLSGTGALAGSVSVAFSTAGTLTPPVAPSPLATRFIRPFAMDFAA